jgi:hypothetical protein
MSIGSFMYDQTVDHRHYFIDASGNKYSIIRTRAALGTDAIVGTGELQVANGKADVVAPSSAMVSSLMPTGGALAIRAGIENRSASMSAYFCIKY